MVDSAQSASKDDAGDSTNAAAGAASAPPADPSRPAVSLSKRSWLSRGLIGALGAFALVEIHAWYCCGRSTENVRALREARIEGPAVTLDEVRATISGAPREWRRPHGKSGQRTMVLFTYPSLLGVYNIRAVIDEENIVSTVDRDPEPEPVMAPMLEFQGGKMAEKIFDPNSAVPGPPAAGATADGADAPSKDNPRETNDESSPDDANSK